MLVENPSQLWSTYYLRVLKDKILGKTWLFSTGNSYYSTQWRHKSTCNGLQFYLRNRSRAQEWLVMFWTNRKTSDLRAPLVLLMSFLTHHPKHPALDDATSSKQEAEVVGLGHPNSHHDPAYRPRSGHRELVHLSSGEIFRKQRTRGE